MGIRVEFRLFGPVEAWSAGRRVELGQPRQRSIAAVLLTEANQVVSSGTLVDRVWGEQPPSSARSALYSYLTRIRAILTGLDTGGEDVRLTRASGGYVLEMDPDAVDLHLFDRLVDQARTTDDADQAAALWSKALDLCRGDPYQGLTSGWLDQMRDMLDQRQLAALLDRNDVELARGRHTELLAALTELHDRQPLDERLASQLMLAEYRGGRQAEALEHYQTVRRRLADELGVDPSAPLRTLHEQILRSDADLAGPLSVSDSHAMPAANAPAPPAVTSAPCLLPPAPPRFVGRNTEVDRAMASLLDHRGGPAPVVVTGPAGVGKTSLVVHIGHLVAAQFPDGQLYADLGGVQPEPVDPAEMLGRFLRALGMRGQAIPDGLTERIHLYRALLARRRLLVVLDNVANARQVRDLLPNGAGCAALVTSRTSLASLDGVRMTLRVLKTEQALDLLGQMAGSARVAAEPEAARDIVELCGRLPLAVWVASARLAARPHLALAAMAQALTDERDRLDQLVVEDVAVRASVELTYRGLDVDARRALRFLGLLRALDFAAWTLAALLDTSLTRAVRLIDDLVEVHLVEVASASPADTRYRLHDLVRLVAYERSADEDDPATRATALRRMVGACLDLAERADHSLSADFLGVARHRLDRWSLPAADVERLTADPLAWFDREHLFLAAAVNQGLAAGATDLAGCLAVSLTTFFQVCNRFDDWRDIQVRALHAATTAGDARTELKLHRSLGELDTIQDRYADALVHFQTALNLHTPHEPEYEAAVTAGLGYLHRLQGNYGQALAYFAHAAQQCQTNRNINGLVYATAGTGVVHLEVGRLDLARWCFQRSLYLSRDVRYLPGHAQALRCLAQVAQARGDNAAAAKSYQRAMDISERVGDRLGHTHAACWLGYVLTRQGKHGRGRQLLARCLWIYRDYGNAWGEASALWAIACAQLAVGRPQHARNRAQQAVDIWRRIGSPYWLAAGLDTLAASLNALGEPDAAYARAEADRLRSRMAHHRP
jgi:DNA-binding SARP family transcriptional activator